jgi:hypothetical protein
MKIYACAISATEKIEMESKTTITTCLMSSAFTANNEDEAAGKAMRLALEEYPSCTNHIVSVVEVPEDWYQLVGDRS